MKQFMEPQIEILMVEVADIICESVEYYDVAADDFIGWG